MAQDFVNAAADAPAVDHTGTCPAPQRSACAGDLKVRAQRYRWLAETLSNEDGIQAARGCARELEAEAARVEQATIPRSFDIGGGQDLTPEHLETQIEAHQSEHRDIELVSDRKSRGLGAVTADLLWTASTIFSFGVSLFCLFYFVGVIRSEIPEYEYVEIIDTETLIPPLVLYRGIIKQVEASVVALGAGSFFLSHPPFAFCLNGPRRWPDIGVLVVGSFSDPKS
jgi:hypothetical protein